MTPSIVRACAALAAIVLVLATSAPGRGQGPTAPPAVQLRGAGATFPAPLYERWITAYRREHRDVVITYDVVGSGEGQRRFIGESVDFGASDAALSDEQMARISRGARLVPVTAGIVVLAYNLPGIGGTLQLPRDVVVDVFAGRIRTWSDPRIRAANPALTLPDRTITLATRQDGSGTTYALTNHLSAVSADWRDRGPGVGTLVDWRGPAMRARGNEGVAGLLKVSEGAIGYVEYHFAKRLKLAMAALQNKHGRFVEPGERGGQAALAGAVGRMPANLRLFLPDPEAAEAYPIVSLSWLLLYERYAEPHKAAALKRFVTWALTEGQTASRELGYIPLPAEIAALSLAALDRIN